MISKLKWSRWDWLLVLAVLLVLIKWLLPDTGLHNALHVFFHWLAVGIAWLGSAIAALFNLV